MSYSVLLGWVWLAMSIWVLGLDSERFGQERKKRPYGWIDIIACLINIGFSIIVIKGW